MEMLFYRIKYHWHLLRFKELSLIIHDCIDETLKNKLKKKIDYHEQAIQNYITKFQSA